MALERWWWIALGLVTAWRLWAAAVFPLQGTEAYYWLWSEHLSAGYYDHPPLVAWAIRLGTLLAGRSELGVRLPALLGITGATLAVHALASRLGGARAGARAGLAALAFPYLTFMAVTVFPDGLMLGFGGLALVLAWDGRWALAGAALGLSFLSKFPAALLGLGTALWARPRRVLVAWAVAGFLVISPFLAWNALHGWSTFAFQLGTRQSQEARFRLAGPLEYVGVQAAAASPVLFGVLVGALVWSARRRDRQGAFLLAHALPTLAVFGAFSFLHAIQPHWPLAGWLPALVALGLAADERARFRVGWGWGVGTGGALTMLLLAAAVAPGLLFGVAGRPEGSSLTEPWALREAGPILARRVPGGGFLLAENHGIAASLQFSSGVPVHWYSRNLHGREYLRWEDYGALGGRDALFVDVRPLSERGDVRTMLEAAFEEVGASQPLLVSWEGRPARTLYLANCRGFRGQPPPGR